MEKSKNLSTSLAKEYQMIETLNAIIDSSYDGLWICDNDGRVIRINHACERINGITKDQVVGKKMADLVQQEGLFSRSSTLDALVHRKTITLIQKTRIGKLVLSTSKPIFNRQGEISMVVTNVRDITDLDRLRHKLEETKSLTFKYISEIDQLQSQNILLPNVNIRSDAMNKFFRIALKVAHVSSTVLIQGETGVGKGFFSKVIHQASKRKDKQFIRVDCAAIPEPLVESELFGYEAGAFTGALRRGKAGYFEMASGGTLFIDEIGELPLKVQVKLLRFLEEGEVIRVGGTTPRKIDVRIIAATHRDLKDMIKMKSFREDLFFRINIIPLRIPPLRERPEDIVSLIHFFINKFNKKNSTNKTISPKAVDYLNQYSFPGNIRELSNLIERLIVLSPGTSIEYEDLPIHVRSEKEGGAQQEPHDWNLSMAIMEREKELIVSAMKIFRVQRKAAEALGINQSTLARKAKKYNL